jgi:hypothetical protein
MKTRSRGKIVKAKRPRAGSLWVDSIALSSIPSFYNLRRKKPHRLCAVVVAYMLQHGTGGLRATATEVVIEPANTLNVQTVLALENWPADLASADRVHNSEHTTVFPIRCDCNHSCVTFVLEKEEASEEACHDPSKSALPACEKRSHKSMRKISSTCKVAGRHPAQGIMNA